MPMADVPCKVIKRALYPLAVMLVCVRWYAAYPLSLRHIEEMMAERGAAVGHATVRRWAVKISPVPAAVFRRRRRLASSSRRMHETYIQGGGHWKYLYRAVDRAGEPRRSTSCSQPGVMPTPRGDSSNASRISTACPRRLPSTGAAQLSGHREHSVRLWCRHRVAPSRLLEQHRRAGPPGDQDDRDADDGFKSFWSATSTLAGIETMQLIRNAQLYGPGRSVRVRC